MTASITTISPQHLHELRANGKEINLIDVRTPAEYRTGHAVGAKLVPLEDLDPEVLTSDLQQSGAGYEKPLYITCQAGFRAQQAAERLRSAGYRKLVLIEGGTEAWQKAGLPMELSGNPSSLANGNVISVERQVQIAIGVLLVLKVFFGFTIHELFFAMIPLIGVGLIFAGATRWCGMARLVGMLPWNHNSTSSKPVTT
jgi:rhodanese-related sulfurtransferase